MLELLDLRGGTRDLKGRLPRPNLAGEGPVAEVRAILAAVRLHGDAALRDYTRRFDGVELDDLRVPPEVVESAPDRVDPALREALSVARDAIEAFHRYRGAGPGPYERDGVAIRTLEIPVDRVGVYVPGGRARYPSTVLMTAVPARVAGVGAIAMCVPPGPGGVVDDSTLAAAALAGVDEVYRVGGAQAIAALAYGTRSIPRVDIVVGPGNRWVSIAQREVRGTVGVPAAFAGPSEVVVIADESVPAAFVAVDVLVQAEHGPDGLAWLVTWCPGVVREVDAEIERMLAASPRRAEIEATFAGGGYAVLVDGPGAAVEVANEIAPEHLELCCAGAESLLAGVRNAGEVFLGAYSPASLGDYVAGPSHVLPTFGSARFASGLGVEDFLKRVRVVEGSPRAIEALGSHVVALATVEGLAAHADSVRLRTAALARLGGAST